MWNMSLCAHQCAGLLWVGPEFLAPPSAELCELLKVFGASGLSTEMHFQLSR